MTRGILGKVRAWRGESAGSTFPMLTLKDIREVVLNLLLLPAVIAPRTAGLAMSRLLAMVLMRKGSRYTRDMARNLPSPIQEALGPGVRVALRRSEALIQYDKALVLRALLFRRWERSVALEGVEHVEDALRAGRGAILWVHPCVSSNLVVKQALHGAGLPLVHLSRPGHGFSSRSAFGTRLASPLLQRPENRYIAERVLIDDRHLVGPLRHLRRRLAENQVVSITAVTIRSKAAIVPCLGGVLSLSVGPIELAQASGAALLSVFTVGSGSRARVVIGPPLPVPGRAKDASSVRDCANAAGAWLEEQALAHRADWTGWRRGEWRRG